MSYLRKTKHFLRVLWTTDGDASTPEGRSADRYRRAAWTSLFTASGRGTSILTGLISVPLTIKYLGTERYGLWMTATAAITVLQFADFGVGFGLLNKVAEASARDEKARIRALISSCIAVLGLAGILIIVSFSLTSSFVSWAALLNAKTPIAVSEAAPTIMALALILAFNMAVSVVVHTNVALQEGYRNGAWQIVGSITGLLGLIVAIQLKAGLPVLITCYLLGPLLASVANGIHLFYDRHPWTRPALSAVQWSLVREMASLGFWFFLFQVQLSFNAAVPNVVTSRVLGLDKVAVFSITWRLASVAVFLQSVMVRSLWPAYAEARVRGDWAWVRSAVSRSLALSTIVGVTGGLVLVQWGAPIISAWAGADVVPPQGVLWGLAVWVVSSSIYGPLTTFLNGMGMIKVQVLFGIVFSCVLVILCSLLTKPFGLVGLSWAYGAAYTVPSVVVAGLITQRTLSATQRRE